VLKLVLDTNMALDWLLFRTPKLEPFRTAVTVGAVHLVTHDFAIEELRRVLTYPLLKASPQQQHEALTQYIASTRVPVLPERFNVTQLLLPDGFPRCSDGDDQPFLALCLHASADALVTQDKALLKLRKRAARFGVRIVDSAQMLTLLTDMHAQLVHAPEQSVHP
jgi:uncharacterized protein